MLERTIWKCSQRWHSPQTIQILQHLRFCHLQDRGQISWKSIHQNCTSLSSCKAKIVATNKCITELEHVCNHAQDLDIQDATTCIMIYNDNDACINWSASVMNKGTKYIILHENYIREARLLGIAKITRIPGVINASDLFTKALKDAAHFRCCRDAIMVSCTNFEIGVGL